MSFNVRKLPEVARITMGQAPDSSSYNEEGIGIPLIAGAGDLDKKFPKPAKFTTEPSKKSKEDDIIMCIRATIGDLNWADKEYALGRGVAALTPLPCIDKKYLWYWLKTKREYFISKGRGATFLQISKSDLENADIVLPEITKQVYAVSVLEKVDCIIEKRDSIIEKLYELKKSLFNKMFGDPELNTKNWPIHKMSDLCSITAPIVDPKKQEYRDFFNIGSANIESKTGRLLNFKTVEEDNAISVKFHVSKEHILYSKIRPKLEKVTTVPDGNFLCSADIYPISPKENVTNQCFLKYLLLSEYFTEKATLIAESRANIPKINRGEIESIVAFLPPFSLQEEFGRWVKVIDLLIIKNMESKSKTLILYDSLIDSYFHKIDVEG